jgi:O-antigen ligase
MGLMEAYVLGAFTASVRALLNFATGATAAQLKSAGGQNAWEEGRYTVAGMNENDLGLILALSIPMAIYVLSRRRGVLYGVLGWTHLGICVVAILLTGSRGALLAAGTGMLMLPLAFSRLPRWQKILSIGAAIAAGVAAAYIVPAETWRRLLSFGEAISHGTLTHRTVIWSAGLEAFRDHALMGVGAGAYGAAIVRAVDISYVAHNTFLSVLVELGVAGMVVFLFLLAAMYLKALAMPRLERRLWTVLLLTWALGVSSLTWEYRKPTWLLFGLLVAHVHSRDWARKI